MTQTTPKAPAFFSPVGTLFTVAADTEQLNATLATIVESVRSKGHTPRMLWIPQSIEDAVDVAAVGISVYAIPDWTLVKQGHFQVIVLTDSQD